jgi:hypothetical protein
MTLAPDFQVVADPAAVRRDRVHLRRDAKVSDPALPWKLGRARTLFLRLLRNRFDENSRFGQIIFGQILSSIIVRVTRDEFPEKNAQKVAHFIF